MTRREANDYNFQLTREVVVVDLVEGVTTIRITILVRNVAEDVRMKIFSCCLTFCIWVVVEERCKKVEAGIRQRNDQLWITDRIAKNSHHLRQR